MQKNKRTQEHVSNRISRIKYRISRIKYRVSRIIILYLACASLCLLAGCAQQQQFKAVEQICVPDTEKAEAMQIAEDVLGQMHFTIAKADPERGYIRTRPLSGAQFFELWRSDNVGALAWAEANLHSIRRIVELDVRGQDEQLCIGCDVKVQRLNLPERQITGSAPQRFLAKARVGGQKRGMCWVDLGPDRKLETKILKRIEKRMKRE